MPGQASKKRKATSQNVEGLPEGQLRGPPHPPGDTTGNLPGDTEMLFIPDNSHTSDVNGDRLSLHSDDPANFLKLSMAIRILIKRTIVDDDIDEADRLLREYNTELIKVCLQLYNNSLWYCAYIASYMDRV